MRICILKHEQFLWLALILIIVINPAFAGTPHGAGGTVQTSFGSTPAVGSLTFSAFITSRPGEILTQSSPGCNYYSDGSYLVQCGSFPTQWNAGEVLHIDFIDNNTSETGSDDITLTNNYADNGGLTILSAPAESMTAPNTPTGPSSGFNEQNLNFSTGGGSSSLGHPIQYQFDWGDGSQTSWQESSSASHSYSTTGTFAVKARVRCQYHTDKVSDWSSSLNVTISLCNLTITISPSGAGNVSKNPDQSGYAYNTNVQLTASGTGNYVFSHWSGNLSGSSNPQTITMNDNKSVTANFVEETVSTPNTPTGPSSGFKGQSLNFNTGGAVNNLGHPVEYQFDWGNGVQSSWGSSSASYSYNTTGTFDVRARARCQYHQTVISGWSSNLSVTISYCALTTAVSPGGSGSIQRNPDKTGYDYNENVQLTASASGNYVFINWSGDLSGSTNPQAITMNGNKSVTANFIEETVSTPNTPTGSSSGFKGQSLNFSTGGAVNNLGHPVEYQFDWGNGVQSSWGSSSASYTYNSTGTFNVRARARCQMHPSIVSDWSSSFSVTISYCTLTTAVSPTGTGSILKNPDKSNYDYNETVQLTASPSGSYIFSHWSGDLSGSNNPQNITMNGNKSVTANFVDEMVSTPNTPTGPSSGFKGQSLIFGADGAVNNLGHPVEYQFDWGDGSQSSWVSGSASYSYSATGTYQVRARARCQYHPTVISGWSSSRSVTISYCTLTTAVSPVGTGSINKNPDKSGYDYNEAVQLTVTADEGYGFSSWSGDLSGSSNPATINMTGNKNVTANILEEFIDAPNLPGGPSAGFKGESLYFLTVGAISNLGHAIEYQYDWGDGNLSEWGSGTRYYTYSSTGTFLVRARARCQTHTNKISGWSPAQQITISLCMLSIAVNPTEGGSVSKNPDKTGYDYNETVQLTASPGNGSYRFANWSGNLSGSNNPQNIIMDGNKSVTADFTIETVSTPNTPSGPSSGITGQELTFTTGGASSSFGHSVEYQFNWGDGSGYSAWGSDTEKHMYTSTGTFYITVRARCQSHTNIVSNWSNQFTVTISSYTLSINILPAGTGSVSKNPDKAGYDYQESVRLTANANSSYAFSHWSGSLTSSSNPVDVTMNSNKTITANYVEITETVSTPNRPTGPASGIMGQSLSFSTGGASSNLGHEVEYRFDWGDGTLSSWGSGNQQHIFDNSGAKQVKAQARCKTHTIVVSSWSEALAVTITGYTLTISIDPAGTGTVTRNPDKAEYASAESVILTANPTAEYTFDHWSGDLTGSANPGNLTMTNNKSVVAHFIRILETVSTPTKPTGPTSGIMGQSLNFNSSGANSNLGHAIEYHFDWGDGMMSDWSSSTAAHIYHTSGIFSIKAQARCQTHPEIVSSWSEAHSITISGYTLSISITPSGSGNVTKLPDKTEYEEGEAISLTANALPGYLFDHWSGDLSGSENPKTVTMNGHKTITANFSEIPETVSTPQKPAGSTAGFRNQPLIFTSGKASSNLGHTIEYQFDWGNGTSSAWGDSSQSYYYSESGDFAIRARARCKTHTSVASNWSDIHTVTISGCNLTVTILPENASTVDINPDQSDYDYGANVTLSATNNHDYKFSHWNDDINDTSHIKIVLMDNHKTIVAHFVPASAIDQKHDELQPSCFMLYQNYPNPFNPETTIQYQLAEACHVCLTIYNVKGERIIALNNKFQEKGLHSINWTAKDDSGNDVPSGIYFLWIHTERFKQVNKMLLIR